MRQLKLLGVAAMAIFAIGIAVASSAQAEVSILPEGLKFTFKSTGKITIESASGKKIECTSLSGKGEGLSERLGDIHLDFVGCTGLLGVKCTSLEDTPEGTILINAEYHLRHLLPTSEGAQLVILFEAVHFTCAGVLFTLSPCVSSMDLLTEKGGVSVVNKLVKSFYVSFLQEKGVQKPSEIDTDNSLTMELCHLSIKEGNNASEQAGLLGEGTVESCKTAVECTFLVDLSGTP